MDVALLAEDAAMRENNTIRLDRCRLLGIDQKYIDVWRDGTVLEGHTLADAYDMDDYPSVKVAPEDAARELDRLHSEGKIHWYDRGTEPADLCIAPTTLILKAERARLVHDWTRAGLNEHLVTPTIKFHTMDTFVGSLKPGCFMAGLDIKDCIFHWSIRSSS